MDLPAVPSTWPVLDGDDFAAGNAKSVTLTSAGWRYMQLHDESGRYDSYLGQSNAVTALLGDITRLQTMTSRAMPEKLAKDQPQGSHSNYIEKIVIIGAGGRVGRHLLAQVLEVNRFAVTVIRRPNSSVISELPRHIKVVEVDYSGDDDAALVQALQGQQALIVTMAVMAPPGIVGKLVRAAAKAGVPYILPNWYGHDANNDELCQDSILAQRRDTLLAEIKGHGVSAYFLIVCNFWYEFSLGGGPERFGFDFKKRSLTWFDDGNMKFNVTTWPQTGRAVANLLSLKIRPDNQNDQAPTLSQFANKAVYVSSFLLSQRDMFESVKRVTGTTEADWNISQRSSVQTWEESKEALLKFQDHSQFVKMLYSRMFCPQGGGDYESTRGLDNDVLALPVEDLDEWTAVAIRMGENDEVNI